MDDAVALLHEITQRRAPSVLYADVIEIEEIVYAEDVPVFLQMWQEDRPPNKLEMEARKTVALLVSAGLLVERKSTDAEECMRLASRILAGLPLESVARVAAKIAGSKEFRAGSRTYWVLTAAAHEALREATGP